MDTVSAEPLRVRRCECLPVEDSKGGVHPGPTPESLVEAVVGDTAVRGTLDGRPDHAPPGTCELDDTLHGRREPAYRSRIVVRTEADREHMRQFGSQSGDASLRARRPPTDDGRLADRPARQERSQEEARTDRQRIAVVQERLLSPGCCRSRQSACKSCKHHGSDEGNGTAHTGKVPSAVANPFSPEQDPNDRRDRFNGGVATGFVGIYSFELYFPGSHSLKEKRMYLRSVKAQLTNRISCSIAEVDHHEVWQRARLTLACVARDAGEADRLLDTAERWLVAQDFELLGSERELVTLDD